MSTLNKTYSPQEIEQHWYRDWEEKNYFAPSGEGKSYCIMLPPPNVTGSLHMGHGFGFTLMDVLIRYHRMCGDDTLWQPGTDHAGIATQMVVERRLNLQGKTRHDLGREAFIEKIWEWKAESGGNITQQLRRLGASLDWQRERFTLDEELSYAVREVFIRLYEEGLIYRGNRLVNWDPVLSTAISDLEVSNEEEEGKLWSIRYQLEDSHDFVVIATTRPETLFGDVAIAVHPDDKRHQSLIGKHVKLPLTDRTIPIIADTYVDPLFGSGCVKITPAHDFNDYTIGKNHDFEPINILNPTATLNENVPVPYQGFDRFKARSQVIKDLEAANLIEKIEKHKLKIPRGDRSNAIIEPYLTHQWYVKSKHLAKEAIRVVEDCSIRFVPENWNKTYFQWMHNMEDWCISRQLWWGHRIPVWYDDNGNTYAAHNEAEVRQKYNLSPALKLTQDEDVLDTWFSSALWPFTTLGWPHQTKELEKFFPTSVLVTGFDIIFFWVARMIMMSLKFTQKIPFRHVYITGLIRDTEGQKMSKTKGNVLDPIDLIDGIDADSLVAKRTYGLMQPDMAQKIEKNTRKEFPQGIPSYGTDALRFTFCSFASYTREIRFDISRLGGYRNFCNKLWNAARYVLMNTENFSMPKKLQLNSFSLPDRFIQMRLQLTIKEAKSAIADYRFDLFAQALYDFTWNEYCDWYLELSKPILISSEYTETQKQHMRYTLLNTLEQLLRLLHPITPFITEEIWQKIAPLLNKKSAASIMLAPYPELDLSLDDEEALREIKWLKSFVTAIRTVRSEMNVQPSKTIDLILRKGSSQDKTNIEKLSHLLRPLIKFNNLSWLKEHDQPPQSVSIFLDTLEIYIPLAGLIDKNEERKRLLKELDKLEKEYVQIENKLANPQFSERAPRPVVEKEQVKLSTIKAKLEKLTRQLNAL